MNPTWTAADAALERALRRDRLVVCTALAAVAVLAWLYLLAGAGMAMSAADMTRASQAELAGAPGAPVMPVTWSATHAAIMFLMWWVMMIAMMLPGAAPMVLLFAAVNRRQRERGGVAIPTWLFALAYLGVWGLFSAAAVAAQWWLQSLGWLSPMLVGRSAGLGAVLLMLAGAWQLTPFKQACLRHCRSPLGFISSHWRPGRHGALVMGVRHGAYCVGCCWILMLLLFVGGVMNLWWIVGIALFVLLEKTVPAGHWLGRLAGVALLAAGAGWLVLAW